MYSFIINVLNALIRGLGKVCNVMFGLLPDSPFQTYIVDNVIMNKYIGFVNYFVPVGEMIVVLEGWLLAISAYYLVQIVLRWLRAIE